MSLYPTLEDLTGDRASPHSGLPSSFPVDTIAKSQVNQERVIQAIATSQVTGAPVSVSLYGDLGLAELAESYGGLDISMLTLQKYVTPEVASQMQVAPFSSAAPIAAVTPLGDKGIARAEIKQGVREVIVCKDQKGKVGVSMKSIDKGVFVSFVWRGSSAAMAGLRFGDQILSINGEHVAGWSTDKALSFLKKADGARIRIAVRDRPFDRTITVVKDSNNVSGFVFNNGEITAIVKDSSAARFDPLKSESASDCWQERSAHQPPARRDQRPKRRGSEGQGHPEDCAGVAAICDAHHHPHICLRAPDEAVCCVCQRVSLLTHGSIPLSEMRANMDRGIPEY
jgi:syntenin-1